MEAEEPACLSCGDHRRTLARAGAWLREDRVYADRNETRWSDFGSGTSFRISRDRQGAIQSLTVERIRDADGLGVLRRTRTDRLDLALGEPCEIWSIVGQYYRRESCETRDGIQLWIRDVASQSSVHAARTVSVVRRPVALAEVRPPADFFQLAPWPQSSAASGYEVALASRSRRELREEVRRRFGDLASGLQVFADRTRHAWATDRISHYRFDAAADGRPIRLVVELLDQRPLLRSGWLPVPRRRSRTVLGERCSWQYDSAIQSTDQRYECRTGDGIPLMIEIDWHWHNINDIYVAQRLSRRPPMPSDYAAPATAVDWTAWGVGDPARPSPAAF